MVSRTFLSELKLPAHADFIPVAKRVATSLGSKLGFSLEELDELGIAVAQACDSTIDAAAEMWVEGATLKLVYSSTDRGIAVEVEALGPRSPQALPRAVRPAGTQQLEVQRLAQEMIRCFVDDFRSQVDLGRGQVRFRMVKYLIS